MPYLSIFVAIIGPLEIQPRRIRTAANHGQQRGHVISSNAAKMTFFSIRQNVGPGIKCGFETNRW